MATEKIIKNLSKSLKKKIRKKINFVSYPNGNKIISNNDLRSLGIIAGFTTNIKFNKNKFYTPRLDCNQIKI